jgi:hypothetical protein
MIRTMLAAGLLLCTFTVCQAESMPAGKLANWFGGPTDILTYGEDQPIGRIEADGAVSFRLPTPPVLDQTVADTFVRCSDGELTVENGEARLVPVIAFIEHDGRDLGMIAASSEARANYSLTYGQSGLVRGYDLRWVHVDAAASVTGRCESQMNIGAGPVDFVAEYQLDFLPGWNLVRTAIVEYVESEDGSRQETHTRYDALQAFPQEAMWYLDQ